jgi:sugar lactone lactonase YvrE
MAEVTLVQAANALLGEGPSWHANGAALYWVDVLRPAVLRHEPARGQTGLWPLSGTVGCAVPRASGGLLLASDDSFLFLDTDTGMVKVAAVAERDRPFNRFNDGKVDRHGRFWAGTIDRQTAKPTGSLYRLDADLLVTRMETGLICSNGLGWSPDDKIMYFTDSMVRTIWQYDFDAASGTIDNRRVFAKLADDDGVPDGLTVDAEGFVWSAVWDGWRIVRYAPDGSINREIIMPVQRPSSCMFGGPGLRTLYVTSACADLSASDLLSGPLAGALFAIEPGVAGLPETPFAG